MRKIWLVLIVAAVIAVFVLIFILPLTTTPCGLRSNVQQLDDKVKSDINKLFTDEPQKIVLYPRGSRVSIPKGSDYGIAFAIKNTVEGEAQAGEFTYNILATSIERGCPLSLDEVNSYIKLGKEASFQLSSGERYYSIVHLKPSDSAPLCIVGYEINVTKDGMPYVRNYFDVEIEPPLTKVTKVSIFSRFNTFCAALSFDFFK